MRINICKTKQKVTKSQDNEDGGIKDPKIFTFIFHSYF